ncbi:MAG: hypothetical protein GY756_13065 [bacterium]|nr:hypothetical protein [bacterium]
MNNLFSFSAFSLFRRNIVFIIILFALFHVDECYSVTNDTIPKKYSTQDTAWYNALTVKMRSLIFTDPDSVLNLIIHIEENTDEKRMKTLCAFIKGVIYANKGNYKEAVEFNLIAIKKFKELGDDYYVNMLNMNLGFCYTKMTYYSLATEYLYRSRDYFEKTTNTWQKGRVYLILTDLFVLMKEYTKAKEYALITVKYATEAKDTVGITSAYYDIGLIHFTNKDHKAAMEYYIRSLKLSEKSGIGRSITYAQQGIGEVFLATNKTDSARFYFDKVLDNKETDNDTRVLCLRNYAELLCLENNRKNALKFYTNALLLSKQAQIKNQTSEIYEKLAEIYSEMKDFRKAYNYRDSSAVMNDSIFEHNKMKQAAEFEEIYQNKRKQTQIEDLSYENRIQKTEYQRTRNFVIGIVILLALIILSGFFIFRINKLKSKNKNAELEQRLLRSQMNPHFIFNAISSIQSYIIKNKPLEASSYLANFAKLMRHILLNSRKEFISLDNEIETIENYIKLQQLRFEGKFEYSINVSDEIDEEEIVIPPMILQPFIENAVKHGISKKVDSDGMISIDFSLENDKLILEVEDNGIGRTEADKLKKKEHKSLATEITNNRLALLGKSFKKKAEISILDLTDDNKNSTGTKVIIKLPVKSD